MSAKLVSKFVRKHCATILSARCIFESAFVEITPLPGGTFMVSVNADSEHLLRTRYNVLSLQGMNVRSCTIYAVTAVEAAEKVRRDGERVCFVGTHEVLEGPADGVEYFDADAARENGFAISHLHQRANGLSWYRLDEWVQGKVVMTCEGQYDDVRRVMAQLHPAHWQRRYNLQALCGVWQRFLQTQLDPLGERLAEEFLFYPIGARVSDVAGLFEAANPHFASARKEMFGA